MRASKESAERARDDLDDVCKWCSSHNAPRSVMGSIGLLSEFLNVAKRKLPTEAAYERDRKRKRS